MCVNFLKCFNFKVYSCTVNVCYSAFSVCSFVHLYTVQIAEKAKNSISLKIWKTA